MPSILLLAARGGQADSYVYLAVIAAFVIIIMLGLFVLVLKYYKRCPANRLLVVYGKTGRGEAAVCIHGGARLVQPLIQDYAWLSLEPIQMEFPLKDVPAADDIRLNVRTVLTVAIGTTPELMQNAAIRLLGLSFADIEKLVNEIILGQIRQVIASMRVEEIIHDRDKFLKLVHTSLEPDLHKMGLLVVNATITDVSDDAGYLDTLSQKATAAALLATLLNTAFDGSALRLVAHLLEGDRLSSPDREQIRRLLDASDRENGPA